MYCTVSIIAFKKPCSNCSLGTMVKDHSFGTILLIIPKESFFGNDGYKVVPWNDRKYHSGKQQL